MLLQEVGEFRFYPKYESLYSHLVARVDGRRHLCVAGGHTVGSHGSRDPARQDPVVQMKHEHEQEQQGQHGHDVVWGKHGRGGEGDASRRQTYNTTHDKELSVASCSGTIAPCVTSPNPARTQHEATVAGSPP